MASTYNITIDQGSTFRLRVTWKDQAGVAISLTGFTARMKCRKAYRSTDPPLFALTEVSGITLGGAAGTIDVLLSDTQTAAFASGGYVYDLEVESASGETTRLIKGTLTVDPEVTW